MEQYQHCKQTDEAFDVIFDGGCQDETVPATLLRAAAKLIISSYPDNTNRALAISHILASIFYLLEAGK